MQSLSTAHLYYTSVHVLTAFSVSFLTTTTMESLSCLQQLRVSLLQSPTTSLNTEARQVLLTMASPGPGTAPGTQVVINSCFKIP